MAKVLVQKFGGTSVDSDAHRRLAARKVIAAKKAGYDPVVVVSAIGRKGAPYATDTLRGELIQIDPASMPTEREMDMMMACGEIISTAVMATTLQSMGYPAVALSGGQAGIITDDKYGDARILAIHPHTVQKAIERGQIPVVCGFQGVTATSPDGEHGGVTTLGRGGSDTTGSALGAALNAVGVEIYTDVDGVKTADPSMVSNTRTLDVCSYEEVAEMAHLGAKIVHPRAAEIAMDYGIPLWVKSTFSDHPGTRIVAEVDVPEEFRQRVTGVTHTGKIAFIRLEIENEQHKSYVEQEVYRLMARAGVDIFLVSYSPTALSFAVNRTDYQIARDILDGMIVPVITEQETDHTATFYIFKFSEGMDLAYSAQRPLLKPVENFIRVVDVPGTVFENGTMVSVVAGRHREVPGIMSAIYETLNGAGIRILQVADSDMSISLLVAESEAARAVRLLHDSLGLEE